jgi:hypothetical protein
MSDTFTTISRLINSPPGQLAAGGVLAGLVWKFFERVEAVLTDQTKLEIAVWLLGVKVGQKVEPWPDTFSGLLNRVFGSKHFTLRCFLRSSVLSMAVSLLVSGIVYGFTPDSDLPMSSFWYGSLLWIVLSLFANVIPNYLALLETRYVLRWLTHWRSNTGTIALLVLDRYLTLVTATAGAGASIVVFTFLIMTRFRQHPSVLTALTDFILTFVSTGFQNLIKGWTMPVAGYAHRPELFFPAFFTSIWLWLYAGSGFLLKAARRFDLGFDWFNRHFDIEKKPLQSIGLVAGALVAVVYWTAVIVSRVIG